MGMGHSCRGARVARERVGERANAIRGRAHGHNQGGQHTGGSGQGVGSAWSGVGTTMQRAGAVRGKVEAQLAEVGTSYSNHPLGECYRNRLVVCRGRALALIPACHCAPQGACLAGAIVPVEWRTIGVV